MSDEERTGRGGPREGAGRPPLYDGPLSRSSFTAPEGYIIFLRRFGGEKTTSAGIRRLVELTAELSPEVRAILAQVESEGYDIGNALT